MLFRSGGGVELLKVQILGVWAVALWTIVTTYYLFKTIDLTVGLRVTSEEEEEGLDKKEHGTESYADFQPKGIVINPDQI